MNPDIQFKIADTLIKIQAGSSVGQTPKDERMPLATRFRHFVHTEAGKPDIEVTIETVQKLPYVGKSGPLFVHYNADGNGQLRVFKKLGKYIYSTRSLLKDGKETMGYQKRFMFTNSYFDKSTVYLFAKKNKNRVFPINNLIHDMLQQILAGYLAAQKIGIFTHGCGIENHKDNGLLFLGASGSGKSTLARLWFSHSRAQILNDDRVIIRKTGSQYIMHSNPWSGRFGSYLKLPNPLLWTTLKTLFFIQHASRNQLRPLSEKEAFNLLYANMFPLFWDKSYLKNTSSLCQGLVEAIPCYMLGFVNNKTVIDFIRGQFAFNV